MSVIKTTKVWNGLTVEEFTDTDTGVMEIRSGSFLGTKGDLLATGDSKGKWTYNDQSGFRRRYNNRQRSRGKQPLSKEEFNKKFFTDGTKSFNNDRADILNTETNYDSKEEFLRNTKSFIDNGLPSIKDPETGEVNNSEGDKISDPENKDNDEQPFESLQIEEIPIARRTGILTYPIGRIPDLGYDFVSFTAHEYQAGALTTTTGEDRLGTPLESIYLPIIPNIEETNSVSWGEDKMNALQAEGAKIAMESIGAGSVGEAISNLANNTGEAINRVIGGDDNVKNALIQYFAGQAVGANVLGRTSGAVLNPNLELLFAGPKLRSFNFNFKLRPRFPEEAERCKEIIRSFKRNMHVQRSTKEIFLKTPNIYKIKYIHNNTEEHPFMNRLKPCALTNFKVNYTPDNAYMTYPDGSMIGYDISLSFGEIAPIYADEIDEQGGTSY